MAHDQELVLIFGGLHLAALAFGILLFVLFMRSESRPWRGPEEDEGGGGGGNDRLSDPPKTSPSGGVPLPDAVPARFRLRSHERLRDLMARPERRRVAEPARERRRVG